MVGLLWHVGHNLDRMPQSPTATGRNEGTTAHFLAAAARAGGANSVPPVTSAAGNIFWAGGWNGLVWSFSTRFCNRQHRPPSWAQALLGTTRPGSSASSSALEAELRRLAFPSRTWERD